MVIVKTPIKVCAHVCVCVGANLKGVDMEGSQMTGINLRVATLKNAKLKNCNLRGATLAGTDLEVCPHRVMLTYFSQPVNL